jgi:O-antigen ligase
LILNILEHDQHNLTNSQYQQNLNWTWLFFYASVLFFPLFPALGALGLVIVLVIVWCNNQPQIYQSLLNRGFGLLTGLLVISSALAEYPTEAWLGLANFLPFFALFIALRCLITSLIQLRQLSWVLILPSLPIVMLGLGQIFLAWSTTGLIKSIFGWGLTPGGVPTGRMSSVFIYANFLAIYLAIAFTLTVGLWLEIYHQKSTKQRPKILLLLTIFLLADICGLVLTNSRNAWGLAVFSLMAYALYLGWKWLVWAVMGAATAIFWASFVPSFGGTQLRQIVPSFIWLRLSDQSYERPLETLRITQWEFCWDLIKQRPLFGWGLRNFTPLYEAKTNLWLGHPHNLFLMLGAETGIITLLLLLTIIFIIVFQAVRLLQNSLGKESNQESKLIFFSYLVAFTSCILFNLADVSIFDLRINILAWILLAAISGGPSSELSKNKIN